MHNPSLLSYFYLCSTLVVLCIALAVLFQDILANDFSHVHDFICLAVLVPSAACACHWARACWIANSLRSLHRNSLKCLDQCLTLLNHQGVVLKRSIRYIQEAEVISRGFTL